MRIVIEIDELVLHGFQPGDRHAIGDAVQTELARIVAERGLPAGLSDGAGLDALSGGGFPALPGARPSAIGTGAAEAIHAALSQGLAPSGTREGR
jgi:hypothetical protein